MGDDTVGDSDDRDDVVVFGSERLIGIDVDLAQVELQVRTEAPQLGGGLVAEAALFPGVEHDLPVHERAEAGDLPDARAPGIDAAAGSGCSGLRRSVQASPAEPMKNVHIETTCGNDIQFLMT